MPLILKDSTGDVLARLENCEIPSGRNVYFIDELTTMINLQLDIDIDTDWVRSMWDSREEEKGDIILQAECMCGRE